MRTLGGMAHPNSFCLLAGFAFFLSHTDKLVNEESFTKEEIAQSQLFIIRLCRSVAFYFRGGRSAMLLFGLCRLGGF